MSYYPIFIEMTGRHCAVVGGGVVAERKVEALLNAGAAVTVISPSLTGPIHSWVAAGKVRYLGREYRPGDLSGFEMVFVATNDRKVNPVVFQEARERGVWVNAADDPPHCDFILPSVLQRGNLVVAVSSGGSSPALSKSIREELESYFTEEYAEVAQVAAEVRRELRQRSVSPDAKAWRQALGDGFRRLIAEGKREEAKAHLMDRLG
ncbi:MAG: bifunctional precorrin-2 dehydrogenase/sirohydrochlorin ferrochelatase [Candidatus Binatia bacterium]